MQCWIFSTITQVFSVTWSFRNHSNMLICCSRNISSHYQYWKWLCCLYFFVETMILIFLDSLMNRKSSVFFHRNIIKSDFTVSFGQRNKYILKVNLMVSDNTMIKINKLIYCPEGPSQTSTALPWIPTLGRTAN